MNNRYFWISFFVVLILQFVISTICTLLIPNDYIAEMVSAIILSFCFALLQEPDKLHFYSSYAFWYRFLLMGVLFLGFDLVMFFLF